jgi:hypothetical protein
MKEEDFKMLLSTPPINRGCEISGKSESRTFKKKGGPSWTEVTN